MKFADHPHPGRRSRSGGFTLIEAMVALAILATTTLVLQRTVMTSLYGVKHVNERIDAEIVARSLLSAPLLSGSEATAPRSGEMNGLPWKIRFEQIVLPASLQPKANEGAIRWLPVRMTVSVAGQRGMEPPFEISTVRLIDRGEK